jgi:hypothetical protein
MTGYWHSDHYFDGHSDVATQVCDEYGRPHYVEEMRPMDLSVTEELPAISMQHMTSAAAVARGLDQLGAFIPCWYFHSHHEDLQHEVKRILASKGFVLYKRYNPDHRCDVYYVEVRA